MHVCAITSVVFYTNAEITDGCNLILHLQKIGFVGKALVISMYFEPLNLVPVRRISTIVRALYEAGFETDIFTRNYTEANLNQSSLNIARSECDSEHSEKTEFGEVFRSPYTDQNTKQKLSAKLPPGIKGVYNLRNIDVFHYDFQSRFQKWFEGKHYDIIILSYGPPVVLSIAKWLRKHTSAKIIVDFRDAFITEHDRGWIRYMKRRTLRKVAVKVDGMTFASPGVREITNAQLTNPVAMVDFYNAVEPNEINEPNDPIIDDLNNDPNMVALHSGSLYPGQNIKYFVQLFGAVRNETKISFYLMGLADHTPEIDPAFCKILPKVSFDDAQHALQSSDILVLPVWEGRYTGFSGKLIDYLHAGKKVLCGPNPQDDLKEILKTSPNAYVLSGDLQTDIVLLRKVIAAEIKSFDRDQYETKGQIEKLQAFIEEIIKS